MADPYRVFRLRRGETGLREALDRLRLAMGPQNVDLVAVSCAEAAMWACALDEIYSNDEKAGRRPGYISARDADEDGRVLPGLRWARNRGVHELLHPYNWNNPAAAGAPVAWEVRWVDRDRVPHDANPAPKQQATYDQYLVGQKVG
jgi:hypothetical protein